MRLPLLALVACSIAAVGCGSSGAAADRARTEAAAQAAQQVGEIVRFGGGWKTDFTRHTVPLSEFRSGGPGKDGIPAVDRPRFIEADHVDFVNAREPVIELVLGHQARAYPLQILIWHEIVNDRIATTPVAVTFCPLCNTAVAFDRRVGARTLSFGTTGNLRNSDLVMYDRQTESWWQQFGGDGVVGRYAGRRLRQLPARIVAWRDFGRAHPLLTPGSLGVPLTHSRRPFTVPGSRRTRLLTASANEGESSGPPRRPSSCRSSIARPSEVTADRQRPQRSRCRRTRRSCRSSSSCSR